MQQPQLLDKTVLPEYKSSNSAPTYDSIDQIQQKLIEQLIQLGYKYAQEITTEQDYVNNLRRQLEHLNTKKEKKDFSFSDRAWNAFYRGYIKTEDDSVERKLRIIQQEGYPTLEEENSNLRESFSLIDKSCWENNSLQIASHPNLCSIANIKQLNVLINGFPLVHIVLLPPKAHLESAYKKLKVEIIRSVEGLFGYIHIFILSNGTRTKWYVADLEGRKEGENDSQDFKNITNYWTDRKHTPIEDISDFALHFLNRQTILNLLTKYCIITENKFIVLKPYQIDAAESIFNHIFRNIDNSGNKSAGGYVWHSTGSGKTLTAFMSCKLIQDISEIEKIFLLEDRKALEFQVNREFERFGSAQDFANKGVIWADKGEKLSDVLENPSKYKTRMILTTIQKLYQFCDNDTKTSELFNQKVAFIIDECHRDNFGKMHAQIIKKFKKYFIFGFTGTPIFEENAAFPQDTTENYFGRQVGPSYTIYRSIKDGNTLRFWLFEPPEKDEEGNLNENGTHIPLLPQEDRARVRGIARTVWREFEEKTIHNGERFNGMLAVKNVEHAINCYNEFKELNKSSSDKKLMVACVFTATKKEDIERYKEIRNSFREEFEALYCSTPQEQEWNRKLRKGDVREESYKEVVTEAFKERKIDLLIVADMFLTGFDAPKLNTLWLDKPTIKWHTLIQAFSRTNRWHKNKEVGKIVSFNNISSAVDEAVQKFSEIDDDVSSIYKKFTPEEFSADKAQIEAQITELDSLKREIESFGGRAENHKEKKFIKDCKELEKNTKRLRNYGELWRSQFGEKGEERINEFTILKEKLMKERAKEKSERIENVTIEIPYEGDETLDQEDFSSFSLVRKAEYSDKYIRLMKLIKETAGFRDSDIKKLKKAIQSKDKDLVNTPGWISRMIKGIKYIEAFKRDKVEEEIIKLANEIMEEEIDMRGEIFDTPFEPEDVT